MSELRELLDPRAVGLMRGAVRRRREMNAQTCLETVPETAEEALRMVLRAQAYDRVLAQLEQDVLGFFEGD